MSSTMKESSAFQSELRMPESAIRHQSASPADKGKVTICDGKAVMMTNLRRAACVKTSRAAERICSSKWYENFFALHSLNLFWY